MTTLSSSSGPSASHGTQILGQIEVRLVTRIGDKQSSALNIYDGQEILVGRDRKNCQLVFEDSTVSNRHLKIYSIIYDRSNPTKIPPRVYAEDLSSNGAYWEGSLIGNGNNAVLLSDRDEVRISPRITLTFRGIAQDQLEPLNRRQELEKKQFEDSYRISNRKLGSGAHGTVYMAVKRCYGRQLACKIINLSDLRRQESEKLMKGREFMELKKFRFYKRTADNESSTDASVKRLNETVDRKVEEYIDKLSREVEILKNLCHPNLIRLEKVFQSENTLYIFEELVAGGDLYSYIEYKNGSLDEAGTGVIVRQVLEALQYLHERDIVHRDVKPDNILIATLSETARIVLTDFGSATKLMALDPARTKRMETSVGTIDYVAPEVRGLNKSVKVAGYTKAVDLWSLGCVTGALLTGASPFNVTEYSRERKSTRDAILQAAAECKHDRVDFAPEWLNVTHVGKDFVKSLLVLDESARLSAEEALQHRWFSEHKEAYDLVYHKAIQGWKPLASLPDTVELIEPLPKRQPEEESQYFKQKKTPKPIESHLQPFHRRFDRMLSKFRMQTILPSIAEVAEDSSKPSDNSANVTSTNEASRPFTTPKHSKNAYDNSSPRNKQSRDYSPQPPMPTSVSDKKARIMLLGKIASRSSLPLGESASKGNIGGECKEAKSDIDSLEERSEQSSLILGFTPINHSYSPFQHGKDQGELRQNHSIVEKRKAEPNQDGPSISKREQNMVCSPYMVDRTLKRKHASIETHNEDRDFC